jgi:hypothetical protein
VRETEFLEVSTPARYKFSLGSKDGAKLWLDGALVIDNGGIHPLRQQIKALTLTASPQTLRVELFANTVAGSSIIEDRQQRAGPVAIALDRPRITSFLSRCLWPVPTNPSRPRIPRE